MAAQQPAAFRAALGVVRPDLWLAMAAEAANLLRCAEVLDSLGLQGNPKRRADLKCGE